MEIKRQFEILVAVNRRYVVRQPAPGRQIICAECGEAMLTIEQTAGFLRIKQRRIFQIVETEAAHFVETEAGAALICLRSLTAVLDAEQRNNQLALPRETANVV